MASIADLFAPDISSKKNNNVEIAALLRILAKLLDENPETDTNNDDKEQVEVLTRPHFMPSGG